MVKSINLAFIFLILLANFPHPTFSSNSLCQYIIGEMESFRSNFQKDFTNYGEQLSKMADKNGLHLMGDAFTHGVSILEELPKEILKRKINVANYFGLNENCEEMVMDGNGLDSEEQKINNVVEKLDGLKYDKARLDVLKQLEKKWKIAVENKKETAKKDETGEKKVKNEAVQREVGEEEGFSEGEKNDSENDEEIIEGEKNDSENDEEKRLGLVQKLLELIERPNQFVEDIKAELRIRMLLKNFVALKKEIKRAEEKLNAEFDEKIYQKYEKEGCREIEEIIGAKKQKLRTELESLNLMEETKNLPEDLKKALELVKTAISIEKPIIKKVKLLGDMSKVKIGKGGEEMAKMVDKIEQMRQQIDNAVGEIRKIIVAEKFFQDNQTEYADLRTNLNTFQSLISASGQIYNLMEPLAWNKIDKENAEKNLASIHWLSRFMNEKLVKICKPLGDLSALGELPLEWTINPKNKEHGENMNDGEEINVEEENVEYKPNLEKIIILIAENMLFIAAKLEQIYDFEQSVSIDENIGQNMSKLVNKGIVPEQFGAFFYQKYQQKFKSTNLGNASNGSISSKDKDELNGEKTTELAVDTEAGEKADAEMGEDED